jgi:hypothetical protein
MRQLRIVVVLLLIGALTPIGVFFLGASLYEGATSQITNALWAPPLALQSTLESTCSRPSSGTFTCPYGEGQHNRLFFASFFFAYFTIGVAFAGIAFTVWRWRTRPNTSLERTRDR